MRLKPFFGYFGSKWRLAKYYPHPYGAIIEPFAGSAGYSLLYPSHRVILVEKNPTIAGIWRYLLRVSPEEVLDLPDDVSAIASGPAKDLAGMWLSKAPITPREKPTRWMKQYAGSSWWGGKIRARIATQLQYIRHWTIIEGGYTTAPDVFATWFIDPPYQDKGKAYKNGSRDIDYAMLGRWCQTRKGRVIVCESSGANWLPFAPLGFGEKAQVSASKAEGKRSVQEGIWVSV